MKRVQVDAKGLACPQPVVLTKKAIDRIDEGEVLVVVDSEIAKENVTRMAIASGCSITVTEKDAGIVELQIVKSPAIRSNAKKKRLDTPAQQGPAVYLFDADFIGSNMELGKVLVNGFLNAIASLPSGQGTIILLSNAVRLAVEGSYALAALATLERCGYTILICGTCLDFFKIRDAVRAGTVSNALEILERMTAASKVIKF